ncbi:MAG: GAF domain-containing sensor histidine kinase [Gemmatimonadaceae bacterium]|nr:GAF domain-containing sensor histidine kinase [Gemmatimonadaceae bacterium]
MIAGTARCRPQPEDIVVRIVSVVPRLVFEASTHRTPTSGELDLLAAVSDALAREPDGATMRATLCRTMALHLALPFVALGTVHEGDVQAVSVAGSDGGFDIQPALRNIMRVVTARRARHVSRTADEPVAGTRITPESFGWESLVALPVLHHAGHPVAVLCIAGPAHITCSERALQMLDVVANHLSVALDRSDLLARLAEWSNGMEALLAFSGAVHRHREPVALIHEMVEHAAQFLKADGGRGGLSSASETGDVVLESDAYWRSGQWRRHVMRWARGEGIPGRVLDHEFAYLTADYPHDLARDGNLVEQESVQHVVCVPLRDTSHQVVGFLELHRGVDRAAFTWNDAAFLEALADTTAMAIENSRLVSALAAKNAEVRRLFAQHAERIEEERQHIARELHDEAGQALVGVKLALQVLSRVMPDDAPAMRAPLDELRVQVNQATARFRQLARRLRPPALDQHGLGTALAQLVHDTEQRSGFAVQLEIEGFDDRRFPAHETAVFRIVQEALTNVSTHAGATEVQVHVMQSNGFLQVAVLDDGRGFDVQAQSQGLGLRGIAERVHQLNGQLELISQPGAGTQVRVQLPCR